jgi:hypothetical protein
MRKLMVVFLVAGALILGGTSAAEARPWHGGWHGGGWHPGGYRGWHGGWYGGWYGRPYGWGWGYQPA